MIVCENLAKDYNGKRVIDQISFSVKPGQITVITGPSGAGKSTLAKCASLIENPSHGAVKIDSREYQFNGKSKEKIREQFPQLGVVFQNLFLWPHLTNRENILLPVENSYNSKKASRFELLMGLFNLDDFIDKYPNQCSLGQRQRIALARAFLLEPKYLFLDEITSSLDIEQIANLLVYLQQLKDEGVGIFLITHFLKFAALSADQIIFMVDGKIIEQGNKEVLIHPQTPRLIDFLGSLEITGIAN